MCADFAIFEMILRFYYKEKLIEWQNSRKAYKKHTLGIISDLSEDVRTFQIFLVIRIHQISQKGVFRSVFITHIR